MHLKTRHLGVGKGDPAYRRPEIDVNFAFSLHADHSAHAVAVVSDQVVNGEML